MAADVIHAIDAGVPVLGLAGVHVGCYELVVKPGIRRLSELKSKRVAADDPRMFKLIAAQVGLDPAKDIDWVSGIHPAVNPFELLAQGEDDVYLGVPSPQPQELRTRQVGQLLSAPRRTRLGCSILLHADCQPRLRLQSPGGDQAGGRAVLKAAELCASEPERVARRIVDCGFTKNYNYALQTPKDLPYDKWRESDPKGTVRFYALRLHEVGVIKLAPQTIIANGTDWRFLNELKSELKA